MRLEVESVLPYAVHHIFELKPPSIRKHQRRKLFAQELVRPNSQDDRVWNSNYFAEGISDLICLIASPLEKLNEEAPHFPEDL